LLSIHSERRHDVPFFAVVLATGATANVDLAFYEASEGQRLGINFLTVASEQWVDRYVLSAIASFPHQQHVAIADTYTALPTSDHVRYFADTICNSQSAVNHRHIVTETRCKAKPGCSPPGYPPSRLLIIANWSLNWFACVQRSTCTPCRTPPSSDLYANPILWIGPGFGP